jgi:hypothetical protein
MDGAPAELYGDSQGHTYDLLNSASPRQTFVGSEQRNVDLWTKLSIRIVGVQRCIKLLCSPEYIYGGRATDRQSGPGVRGHGRPAA